MTVRPAVTAMCVALASTIAHAEHPFGATSPQDFWTSSRATGSSDAASGIAEGQTAGTTLRTAQADPKSAPGRRTEPSSRSGLFDAPETSSGAESKGAPAGRSGAEPSSRSALFGAPDAPTSGAPRLSGFVDVLAAYTFGDPGHWSRGVGRLQLMGQGTFGEGVKWKVSGRVDADPVYFSSNFYPNEVKRDQRIDVFHRETYLDFSAAGWDFRLGAQHIIWGEVVGLFFADVVSARDQREFILPSFDIIRIPQWAARAEYFKDDSHLELIWIPVPLFDKIGKPGSDFYPVPLQAPFPQGASAVFEDPQRPTRDLNNSNYGVRANSLIAGWDVAAFYYRSFATLPTFYRRPSTTPGEFVFAPRHDRIWQIGGTFTKDLGSIVARGEAVYTKGQNFAVNTGFPADGVVSRETLDWIIGIDYPLPSESRINLQVFRRTYFGGDDDNIVPHAAGSGVTALFSTKLSDRLEPSILWIQHFDGGGGLVRPKVTWSFMKNVSLGFGADIFRGSRDGYFGRFNNRDRVYTELRYDF